jgi:hypothetical protein
VFIRFLFFLVTLLFLCTSINVFAAQKTIIHGNGAIGGSVPINSKPLALPSSLKFDEVPGFSFATWFLVDRLQDTAGRHQIILDTRSNSGAKNGFYLFIDPFRGYLVRVGAKGISGPTQFLSTKDGYADGIWHHVLLNVDSNKEMKLVVDGLMVQADSDDDHIVLASSQYDNSRLYPGSPTIEKPIILGLYWVCIAFDMFRLKAIFAHLI